MNPTPPPPHFILEDSNFYFRYVMLCDLDIPREKWLNYLQTVETLIRRRFLWRLICVCIVYWLPFYGSPDYNGLNMNIVFAIIMYKHKKKYNV